MAVSTIDALYNGGSEKVTATATGIDVTGTVTADGLTVDVLSAEVALGLDANARGEFLYNYTLGDLTIENTWANDAGEIYLKANGANRVEVSGNGDISFYEDTGTTTKFFWDASAESLGIGTSSPSAPLQVAGTTNGLQSVFGLDSSGLKISTFQKTGNDAGVILDAQESSNGTLTFATTGSERMRINSSGHLLISTASDIVSSKTCTSVFNQNNRTGFAIGIDSMRNDTSTSGGILFRNNEVAGTFNACQFFASGNSAIGSIVTSNTATSYNTSSDYRLKTDAQPMTGASARVQALNPVNFEWIADGTRVDGFLAHEAQEVVPEAVHGTKDAMRNEEYEVTPAVYEDVVIPAVLDEDGNELEAERTEQQLVTEAVMGTRRVPDYQGIDQSKLVPLLTAALQEALTEITALKARVTALEG